MDSSTTSLQLPSSAQLRQAIELYLALAYGPDVPAAAAERLPPIEFEPAAWLMSDQVERTPAGAALAEVRSFALRLGNRHYPHMKLRLARLPGGRGFVFDADAHDAMLAAPAGRPASQALAELKARNAALASAIDSAWDSRGLPTTKGLLRAAIAQKKRDAAAPVR